MKKHRPIYKFAVLSAAIARNRRTKERCGSKTCLLEVASEEFVEALVLVFGNKPPIERGAVLFTEKLVRRHLLRCALGKDWNSINIFIVRGEKNSTGINSIFLLLSSDSDSESMLRATKDLGALTQVLWLDCTYPRHRWVKPDSFSSIKPYQVPCPRGNPTINRTSVTPSIRVIVAPMIMTTTARLDDKHAGTSFCFPMNYQTCLFIGVTWEKRSWRLQWK